MPVGAAMALTRGWLVVAATLVRGQLGVALAARTPAAAPPTVLPIRSIIGVGGSVAGL